MTMLIRGPAGNERVFSELMGVEGATRRSIRAAWFELGKDLQRRAEVEILRGVKTGRVYIIRVGGRRRRHVSSAPGETHANLTGALRASIGWKVYGTDSMEFGYGIGGAAPKHARFVELGTRNMEARPSLDNAINASQATAELRWQEAMFAEFNG